MKSSIMQSGRSESSRPNVWQRNAWWEGRAGLLLVSLLAGCAGQAPSSTTKPRIVPEEFASAEAQEQAVERIRGFVDYFRTTVDQAATEIERKAASKEVRQAAALFRVRLSAQCRSAANQANPREALLDLWTLSYRLYQCVSTGNGKQVFGDLQPVAVNAAGEIQTAADDLARQSIAESAFERVHQDVIAYAGEHPMQADFSGQPVKNFSDQPQGEEALRQLIGIPLAPIAALTGVGRTPESVHAVANSVNHFSDVVDDFPANARWQIQLLGTNLSETPQFTDAMASVQQFSNSSARLVNVAQEMPRNLRVEAETLIDRVDKSQPELRETLNQAQQTVATVSSASDSIRGTTAEIRGTLGDVQQTSQAVDKASQSVRLATAEILKLVPATMKDETGQIIGESPAESRPAAVSRGAVMSGTSAPGGGTPGEGVSSQPEDDSFSFQAVTRSADAMSQTTVKLQSLLTNVRSFLESNALSNETGNLDAQWRSATAVASLSVRGIIDLIAWRTAELLLLFFALLIIYRIISRRLQRVRAQD